MRSFGQLLRKLRGETPLRSLAECTGLDEQYLASIEAGRRTAEEVVVRHILQKGFGLDGSDTARLVIDLQVYDLGLRDSELRQLVVELITECASSRMREHARKVYRRYGDEH